MDLTVSISSRYFNDLSPAGAARAFAKAGFCAMELSSRHLLRMDAENERELKEFCADNGFSVPQGHLVCLKTDLCTEKVQERCMRDLECFSRIGVKKAVIHPYGAVDLPEEARFEALVRAFEKLGAFLRGTGITLCLENCMNRLNENADRLLAIIEAAGGGEEFGICLDTGHLNCNFVVDGEPAPRQSQGEFIRKAGKRLQALHLNNNDGSDDHHLLPFTLMDRGVDFREVVAALRKIGYSGLFNAEITGEAEECPPYILEEKLLYAKKALTYLLTDEFLQA